MGNITTVADSHSGGGEGGGGEMEATKEDGSCRAAVGGSQGKLAFLLEDC